MIETERNKLNSRKSEYLSIGITPGGMCLTAVGIPWETTASAYNMRIPDVYLSPEDLQDEEMMRLLESYKVIGCYIWTPLDDYSFLARFKDLQDICIYYGDAIRNLDFLSELYDCRMLYLHNAKLKNLDVIVEVKKKSKDSFGCLKCIGLDTCEVKDLSVFKTEKVQFLEFLVWKPKGSNEKGRWNVISAMTKRYYEYEKK